MSAVSKLLWLNTPVGLPQTIVAGDTVTAPGDWTWTGTTFSFTHIQVLILSQGQRLRLLVCVLVCVLKELVQFFC